MKLKSNKLCRGSLLIEAVIAIGVLAVAVPLVFGAMAEAGKSGMSSKAETRSTWIVPLCMEEIQASRAGRSRYFSQTKAGETFPSSGDVWALGFSKEGRLVGQIAKADYDRGTEGTGIVYIASISSFAASIPTGATPMLTAKVSLEYPAAAPSVRRQKLDFYSRIP
jgi:hypothetical protein